MLWIDTPVGRIGLAWEHHVSHGKRPGTTSCYVTDEDGHVMGIGSAVCSLSDQYCRETGRKVSLTRAMDDHELFPFEMRKTIWAQYFKRKEKTS